MRIVMISDTHGKHRELGPLPVGDVLIHAGDFMRTGRDVEELVDFNVWFLEQPHEHRILIAGNHDIMMDSPGFKPIDVHRFHYLRDSGCWIEGIRFWGSPWTTRFMNWAFMSERGAEMKKHWDLIPDDTQVLVTHGPPQGILDSMPQYGKDLGCDELRKAVLRIQPKLHIFGHIHFGYGQEMLGETRCVNAAVLNDRYQLQNLPVVVDL